MNPGFDLNEAELIKKCISKDRIAQRALYEKYKNQLFTRAYRMMNNNDLANDVLQDSFIEIFTDLKDYKGVSGIFNWMKTIVFRKCLQHLKLDRRFTDYEADKHDAELAWSDGLTEEFLDAAIQTLPDGCRAVFLLAEIDGYKHREIAEMMGIAEGTSKSQLYEAKKMLQKKLIELKP